MKQLTFILFFSLIFSCNKEYKHENNIKNDVVFLSDDKLEGRQTGTDGEQAAADYIAKRFEILGLEPKGTEDFFQRFSFKPKTDPHQKVNYTVVGTDSTITGTNVLGFLDNSAPNTIIIGT